MGLRFYPRGVHTTGNTYKPRLSGYGRLFLVVADTDDPPMPHPGYRGELVLDTFGVWVRADARAECEVMINDNWWAVEVDSLIPWARIDSIEWGTKEERGA